MHIFCFAVLNHSGTGQWMLNLIESACLLVFKTLSVAEQLALLHLTLAAAEPSTGMAARPL